MSDAIIHAEPGSTPLDLLAFLLGSTRYALPLTSIREVIQLPALTEVPGCSDEVMGIAILRGQVTTILDLRPRWQIAVTAPSAKNRLLLFARDHSEVMGLLVDEVLRVAHVSPDQVEPASVLGKRAPEGVIGIGRLALPNGASEVVLLLDPAALLDKESLVRP